MPADFPADPSSPGAAGVAVATPGARPPTATTSPLAFIAVLDAVDKLAGPGTGATPLPRKIEASDC